MSHRPGHHGWEGEDGRGWPIKSVAQNIALYETVANAVAPSKVVAVALNTVSLSDGAALAEIARTAEQTGLPVG